MKASTLSYIGLLIFAFLLLQVSCETQSRGFALPEGDAEAGKRSFVELNCNQCHSIEGIPWAGSEAMGDLRIELGGEVSSIKTYGELVTSVINPSKKIARKYEAIATTGDGQSRMRNYNEYMTVQDLVDIVTFLQETYKIVPPPNPYYY